MKKISRNVIPLIMIIFFIIGLAACSSNANDNRKEEKIPQKQIKNIILFIGDGMGRNQVKFGEYSFDRKLSFTNSDSFTVVDTYSLGGLTDSAAAATAMATGTLTENSFIGINPKNPDKEFVTIMDIAQKYGKSTGIITTEFLTGATPMGFMGHGNRGDDDLLVKTASKSNIDFIAFDNVYPDAYVEIFTEQGYTVINDYEKIAETSGKIFAPLPIRPLEIEGENLITLADVVKAALDKLSKNENGFFLMAEGAHIDHAGHSNDTEYLLRELMGFDEGVRAAIEWAKDRDDTAIFITADHETGGFVMEDFPENDKYNAMVSDDGGYTYHPKYYRWTSGSHTATDVGLWVFGVDIDFRDFADIAVVKTNPERIKNCELFYIWQDMIIGHEFNSPTKQAD